MTDMVRLSSVGCGPGGPVSGVCGPAPRGPGGGPCAAEEAQADSDPPELHHPLPLPS